MLYFPIGHILLYRIIVISSAPFSFRFKIAELQT